MFVRTAVAIAVAVVALVFVRFLLKQEGLAHKDSQSLVGTWKLIDEQTILANGTVVPSQTSSAPIGVLVYDASGHVTSQLWSSHTSKRAESSVLDHDPTTDGTLDYAGYFGTYAVDTDHATITSHMDAALPREDMGKDIAEQFSIFGNQLTTRSRTFGPDSMPAIHVLVWSRLN
jgi:Lipocalin-like domain